MRTSSMHDAKPIMRCYPGDQRSGSQLIALSDVDVGHDIPNDVPLIEAELALQRERLHQLSSIPPDCGGGLRGPILAGCQRQGFGFRTVRYRQPSRTKTRQRASLSHGAPVHMITRTKGPPRRRFLNSSWLVELTPLTNGSGPFHHRDNRDNPSWRSTRWLFPNRLDDAKNC